MNDLSASCDLDVQRGPTLGQAYREAADRQWPIGSGTVESACAQKQGRFKRPGQFWTAKGLMNLNALIEARDSGYWDELWLTA